MPKNRPEIVEVPPVNYIAVRGKGDPNEEGSEYKASIGLLYAIAFTIKMSKKGSHPIEGYFDYVVPPLEGFWWQEHGEEIDYSRKEGDRLLSERRISFYLCDPAAGFCDGEGFCMGAGRGGAKKERVLFKSGVSDL